MMMLKITVIIIINNNLELTGMKLEKARENSIMASFMICTHHQIILSRSDKEG
jgi:hypothetical protein